ncbi:MAG: Omp28-related outer membrane protein [Bacteroidetes bacterium]|nr:Omp28-related outer membrane protein [Bacteroidota bacterium]
MKKSYLYILVIILALASSFIFPSCDKLSEPYLRNKDSDTTTTVRRKILLEDFTAIKCPNCPWASLIAHGLKTDDSNSIVILTIHAGELAIPSGGGDYTYDFRTPVGEELYTYFKVADVGNPTGLINRIMSGPDTYTISPGYWPATVDTMLDDTPIITLDLAAAYDAGNRDVDVTVGTTYLMDYGQALNICVFITEDSIIKPQMNSNPEINNGNNIHDYVHRDVLRGSLNGTWGSILTTAAQTSGAVITKQFSGTLSTEWNDNQCYLVVFVYRTDTKEVIQVEEKKIR